MAIPTTSLTDTGRVVVAVCGTHAATSEPRRLLDGAGKLDLAFILAAPAASATPLWRPP
jgi:hypothetical protein